jgi:hypothetical protein
VTKDWDAVLVVLLDENFDATEIHEAERAGGPRGAICSRLEGKKRPRTTRRQ